MLHHLFFFSEDRYQFPIKQKLGFSFGAVTKVPKAASFFCFSKLTQRNTELRSYLATPKVSNRAHLNSKKISVSRVSGWEYGRVLICDRNFFPIRAGFMEEEVVLFVKGWNPSGRKIWAQEKYCKDAIRNRARVFCMWVEAKWERSRQQSQI